jgi:tetratricopeptide (TPR) repeat protein
MSLLGAADDAAGLWTLAETAALAGDLPSAIRALSIESGDQTSEMRALSDARRARLQAESGEQAPPAKAGHSAEHELDLDAYVRASLRLCAGEDEPEQSFETVSDADASTAASMASADEAARSGDRPRFVGMLDRELGQAPERLKTAMALAIAEASEVDRLTVLLQGEERTSGGPILTRALALVDDDPDRMAKRWIEEGDSVDGERGAFAFVMAARLRSGTQVTDALESALRRQPDYWPALWELEEGVDSAETRAKAALAQASLDPANAASHKLRASMWTRSAEERWALAESTLDRNAPDPLLVEHLFHAEGHGTERTGDLMLLAARKLGSVSYLQRAAASYGAADLPARAAKLLRDACAAAPEDHALVAQRKDAELRAAEFARLADSAMHRAREATDDAEQVRAFCAMAEVDRLARRDMQSARLSLQSIAEMRPDHIPTARALEWDSLREQDPQRMRSSARRLLEALPPDSADRLSRHRLIIELLKADPDILQADIDRLLRNIDDALDADPGLARQVLGAAYAKDEPLLGLRALTSLQASLDHEVERSALALEAARALERIGETERALEALDSARNHPLALEAEARLLQSAKRWEEAAASYQAAARLAKDGRRAASLWREAACIFEEELRDHGRAIDAWVAAARCDISYLDVYRRLAGLYASQGRSDDLAALTEARIEAGADTPTLVGLLLEKATQRRAQSDLQGVIDALRECLELDPQHFTALKELVDAYRAIENWQGAAEALIRIARLKSSTQEQAWAFSELAGIYEEHLGDLERAEACLQRVLKLAPGHVETLDRLAAVLSLQGKAREAARLLEELVRRAGSDAQERDYRIRLAVAVENAGQPRQAELMLESLRRDQPTEPDVILAVADHYDRQGDAAAKAMHLNRGVNDLRNAIEDHPEDEALWTTLVRVLNQRHGPGPASCAASAAIAIGHPPSLFEGDVTNWNEALGEPKLPMSNLVDGLVAPSGVPSTLRRLFALCEHSFDKVLPFDAAAWRLRKPSETHRSLIEEAGAVAEALGISEPHLKVTYVAPSACMPISGDPPTLVIGGNLHATTTPRERVFLFARALKVAATHLAPALRARPQDLDVALMALLHGHEASRVRLRELQEIQELRKKLLKAVPRRWRDEVESLVLELRGNASFSTRDVPFAIAELGDRVALTLTGDVPAALDALLKIAGKDGLPSDVARLGTIREVPEAWALVRFAISDAHFEARAQAGVDP